MQSKCAARGVTLIPEIEAPGHALVISQWKPELRIESTPDLLNLSYPDTIPTLQGIWREFLPWFHSKQVSIGADEYNATLADDYNYYVNNVSTFIRDESNKTTRICGTYEPTNRSIINQDVVVQHWQYGQSEPLNLTNAGYRVINSDDYWAYIVLKNNHPPPGLYGPHVNASNIFHFGTVGQWSPHFFNPVNITSQPTLGSSLVQGAIMPAWNDNGPDATTQLEAYYEITEGIALVGARSWMGVSQDLNQSVFQLTWRDIATSAPGQNLERSLPSATENDLVLHYIQGNSSVDVSGNGNAVSQGQMRSISKGLNYTARIDYSGPFEMASDDASVELTSNGSLIFSADNFHCPIQSVSQNLTGRVLTNDTSMGTHSTAVFPMNGTLVVRTEEETGTRVWSNGQFMGRVEVFIYGGRNQALWWSQMAFVLPLTNVTGAWSSLAVWNDLKDDV